jgi:hypothetical protein
MRRCTPLLLLGVAACNNPAGPPPNLTVAQVTDLGTLPQGANVVGRDGGYSAEFQGQSVWLYSDTFLSKPNALGRTLISDSWAWTTDLHSFQQQDDATGDPAMFLPETPAETQFNQAHLNTDGQRWALWLAAIVADTARDRALIFYSVVHAAPGSFNFYSTGVSVASWAGFGQTPVRPPGLLFQQNEPAFGAAALIDSGVLYVYGCGTSSSSKPCPLGRVDPANVLDRSAWTYWAGNGRWSPNLSDAISVFNGDDILNVSWNAYLGEYVAIYSEPISDEVMIRTAPRPEGPWSGERRIFTARAPAGGGWIYDALAHPEFNTGGGKTMYVSYSRATGTFSSEVRLVAIEFH